MILLLAVYGILGIVLLAAATRKTASRGREVARGLLISYVFVLFVAAGFESYFRFFYADSYYPFGLTLASQNWLSWYGQYNTEGFRDREWHDDELGGRRVILAIGDSFTEGWGVRDLADRFPDVLGGYLGDQYAVINLGRAGTDTAAQEQVLSDYLAAHPDREPDVIIWQYFLNDIERRAVPVQGEFILPLPERPALVGDSHLLDYLFWQVARSQVGSVQSFINYEYAAYDNSVIWDVHRQDLESLVAYTRTLNARLIVVIFPQLQDVMGSIPYVDRVEQAISAAGEQNILKLFDAAAAYEIQDLIVSAYDAHPSPAFHREVGTLIYETFFFEGP
jgi:hypothetical protein